MEDASKGTFIPRELEGKRALVTGGTRGGIEEAIVNRLGRAYH